MLILGAIPGGEATIPFAFSTHNGHSYRVRPNKFTPPLMLTDTTTIDPDGGDDLGFDLAPHHEAFGSFARLQMASNSFRPALRARDWVFVRLPSCHFVIGVTGDPAGAEQSAAHRGSIAFAVIHHAADSAEAAQVRGEVERYFLRHYPGHTLAYMASDSSDGDNPVSTPAYVYLACYDA